MMGPISKADNTDAIVIQVDERAMNRPGHIRRPKPKTASGSLTLGSRKRSGWNWLGLGKTDSSCSTALRGRADVRHRPRFSQRVIVVMSLFCIGFGSPGVPDHHAPGRQEIAFIHIIRDKTMGNRCRA